jgi:dGTPase
VPHIDLASHASAEAQAAAIADDIAWHNHDIDDGLRAGLLAIEDLAEAPLAGAFVRDVMARPMNVERRRMIYEVNRRMITAMVSECGGEARRRLGQLDARSADDVRRHGRPVIAFPDAFASELAGLKAFLFQRVYRHPRIVRAMTAAEQILVDLFGIYLRDPTTLPDGRGSELAGLEEAEHCQRIGDFIAGMTDRFAIAEHRRLFDATPDLS